MCYLLVKQYCMVCTYCTWYVHTVWYSMYVLYGIYVPYGMYVVYGIYVCTVWYSMYILYGMYVCTVLQTDSVKLNNNITLLWVAQKQPQYAAPASFPQLVYSTHNYYIRYMISYKLLALQPHEHQTQQTAQNFHLESITCYSWPWAWPYCRWHFIIKDI
jgi:hypothetical protein